MSSPIWKPNETQIQNANITKFLSYTNQKIGTKFSNYWDTEDILEPKSEKEIEVIDLPNALKEKILEIKPKSLDELELKHVPKLRKYQKLLKVQN